MPLEIRPCTGSLAAEVRGIDVTELDPSGFDPLRRAFHEHHVLVFRDQKLTPEQQVGFGERWGRLFVHPIIPHLPGHPPVIAIPNLGKTRTLTEVWHSDVSFAERPPLGSLLYAIELPEAGGDTLFANQHLAYERLSPGLKRLLEGLRAFHSGQFLAQAVRGEKRPDGAFHPVVRTHPETGRKALYVNEGFTRCFEDMTLEESAPLLRFLFRAATAPDLCYRHRWRPGDMVMWDNRSVQHHAVHDHGDAPRTLHRITVEGDVPR